MTPYWLKAGIALSGLAVVLSFLSLMNNPTVEGKRRKR